jgi:hypothetical protein
MTSAMKVILATEEPCLAAARRAERSAKGKQQPL